MAAFNRQLPGLSLTPEAPTGPTVAGQNGPSASADPAGSTAVEPVGPRTITLQAQSELRFEASPTTPLSIRLLSGQAELFGSELVANRTYVLAGGDGFKPDKNVSSTAPTTTPDDDAALDKAVASGNRWAGVKAAIFTWHGADIRLEGQTESEYVATETEMWSRLNLHFALENGRTTAGSAGIGPRVLVLGPADSGKSSLVRTLAAYCHKTDRTPVVVNLDPVESIGGLAGSLSALVVSSPLTVEHGWGSSAVSGPSAVPVKVPLVYQFGLAAVDENVRMFRALVTRLASATTSKFETDTQVRTAGCIIDTPGLLASGKPVAGELVSHIVSEFSVNVIVTVGSERLYNDLARRYSPDGPEGITVVKLAKSEGCVGRDKSYLRLAAVGGMRSYFFGSAAAPLTPYSMSVDFAAVKLFRAVGVNSASTVAAAADRAIARSFLPGGEEVADSTDQIAPVEEIAISASLVNSVVAIVGAGPASLVEDIRDSAVVGYVYVVAVDEQKGRLTVLSPASGRIPAGAWLVGDFPGAVAGLST